MNTLNVMFRAGENQIHSVEWELIDSPPANAWRRMLDHSLETAKEDPLHIVESVFCGTRDDAKSLWDEARASRFAAGTPYARAQFKKITAFNCQDFMDRLHRILANGMIKTYEDAQEIKTIVDKLKKVQFFLDNVHDADYSNEDCGYGHIHFTPDPKFGIAFEPSWIDYLTMDIVPGTMYADLHYEAHAWHSILEFGDIKNTYEPIKFKRFGPPTLLGSGFYVPFHQDLGGIETELVQFLWDNHNMIKHLDPEYDPVYALRCSGHIPVAKLKTSLGARGYAGYDQLSEITGMFKLEVYE